MQKKKILCDRIYQSTKDVLILTGNGQRCIGDDMQSIILRRTNTLPVRLNSMIEILIMSRLNH